MFAIATHPAPGRPNEDFVIATPDVVVIVDGAGIAHSGCSHGVAWYARRLGTHTMGALVANPAIPLVDALAEGITAVAADHTHTCDLRAAGTPCAACHAATATVDRAQARHAAAFTDGATIAAFSACS